MSTSKMLLRGNIEEFNHLVVVHRRDSL
uniref:Uncharacterized protein n=1 Tax=Rhizophora mucronata TaxID=61149 RepID=A0A2P2P1D8_RHIMU